MTETTDNNGTAAQRQFTWEEILQHATKKDRWLVIHQRVYDITRWTKHPGGQVLLNHYAGQDATVCRSMLIFRKMICFLAF